MIWNEELWNKLAEGFTNGYAGYRPTVIEAPDGKVLDTQKKFLHIAPKYGMDEFQSRCYSEALRIAREHAPVPLDYDACALRVLEYAPGVNGAGHTDFDLLTVNLWRSHPELMVCEAEKSLIHWGELAEDFIKRKPDYHTVEAHPTETQKSIVFFGLPPPEMKLSSGQTVGQWLALRIAKARHYK